MKKNLTLSIFLIFLLSFPAVTNLLHPYFYSSHDGIAHVVRFAKFEQALRDIQIPPRWADGIAFNLGSPVLMYYGVLPYFVAELPRIFGFSLSTSIDVVLALSLILSGISFYIFISDTFGDLAGFVGAIFYIWAPYRFVDIYVRGAYPESFSFIFPPLMLLSAKKLFEGFKKSWFFLGILATAGLLLSHNTMFVQFTGVYLLYAVILFINTKSKRKLIWILFSLILAILLTAFFTIPAFFEKDYINFNLLNSSASYLSNFVTLKQILYSKWGWGPLGSDSPFSTQLGLVQWFVIFASIPIVFLAKRIDRFRKNISRLDTIQFIFFLILLMIAVFLMTEKSLILWEKIPLLSFFLYPWRFLSLAIFSSAVIASFLVKVVGNKMFAFLLIFLVIFANRNNLQLVGKVWEDDSYYQNYKNTTDIWGEFLPKWTNLEIIKKCKEQGCSFEKFVPPKFVSVLKYDRKSNILSVYYASPQYFRATINTLYFPGWELLLDNQRLLSPTINNLGTMDFNLPSGEHMIELKFKEDLLRSIADYISVATLVLLIGFHFWRINEKS